MGNDFNFKDAESIYNYIMEQPLPDKWNTPETLKKSYERTLAAANDYNKAINSYLKQYGSIQPVTQTKEYQKLFDLYNKQYVQGGELAAAETLKAANAADAGYGNTYAKAAGDQAFSAYMANRGAAIPSIMAAASDANMQNKNAIAAGINAMTNQKKQRMGALQSLFNSQFSGIQKENASKRNAYSTLLGSLAEAYAYQKQQEEAAAAAASARSSGGGGGGSYYYQIDDDSPKSPPSVNVLTELYKEAVKTNPGIMTPGEFARRKNSKTYSKYSNYKDYVEAMVG